MNPNSKRRILGHEEMKQWGVQEMIGIAHMDFIRDDGTIAPPLSADISMLREAVRGKSIWSIGQ